MAEVKLYALKISTTETIKKRNTITVVLKKLKGFKCVNPDIKWQNLLFDTAENRDNAFKVLKKDFETCVIENRPAYVDSRYLTGEKKDVYSEMTEEIKAKLRVEVYEEVEEKVATISNENQKLKQDITILKQEKETYKSVADQLKADKEKLIKHYENEKKKLLKEIKSLESDIRRMEKANMFGGVEE